MHAAVGVTQKLGDLFFGFIQFLSAKSRQLHARLKFPNRIFQRQFSGFEFADDFFKLLQRLFKCLGFHGILSEVEAVLKVKRRR